jgi:hypothetical protein
LTSETASICRNRLVKWIVSITGMLSEITLSEARS